MNKIITTKGSSHKKTVAASISILVIIVWIIFSAVYIIQDKWEDYKIDKMTQSYQKGASEGVANSVRTLMSEASKCKKIPLYYGDASIEVVAVSCLTAPEENNSEKLPAPSKKAEEPEAKKPNEPTAEEPAVKEKLKEPEIPTAEQPAPTETSN